MGWLKATKTFIVPHAALRQGCKGKNKLAKDTSK
jgi:hypothetical protein